MKRCLLIPISLALAGCAHFESKPIEPEKSAAQLDARRLDDPGLKKFLEQNLGHETTYPSRTSWNLPELTLVAFYFHPSLEVARAQWLVAVAGIKTAGGRPNPTLTATPEYNTTTAVPSPWGPSVNLDVPIETMGKRGKRIAEAEKVSESARWNFVSAAWKIRSDVRASLLDFKITGRRAELLGKQFTAQKEIVRLLQGRFDAGEISSPELTTAQIALNKTQIDLSDAQSKQSDARSHLAQSLGLTETALDGEKFNFDFAVNEADGLNSAEARQIALRSRADILAALADYAAAEENVRLEIARQYPDVHLNPGYQFDQGDNKWSLGLTVELPILNQNQGPIAEAEARRKLAAAKFVELQSQVIGEIDRAVAGFRVAQEQLQTGAERLTAEQQLQKSAEAQFQAGAVDRLDVLNAQLAGSNAALAQLDSEANLQAAFGALEDALQRPADLLAATIAIISTERPNAASK